MRNLAIWICAAVSGLAGGKPERHSTRTALLTQFGLESKLLKLRCAIATSRQAVQDCELSTAQRPAQIITGAPARLPRLIQDECGLLKLSAPGKESAELNTCVDAGVFCNRCAKASFGRLSVPVATESLGLMQQFLSLVRFRGRLKSAHNPLLGGDCENAMNGPGETSGHNHAGAQHATVC